MEYNPPFYSKFPICSLYGDYLKWNKNSWIWFLSAALSLITTENIKYSCTVQIVSVTISIHTPLGFVNDRDRHIFVCLRENWPGVFFYCNSGSGMINPTLGCDRFRFNIWIVQTSNYKAHVGGRNTRYSVLKSKQSFCVASKSYKSLLSTIWEAVQYRSNVFLLSQMKPNFSDDQRQNMKYVYFGGGGGEGEGAVCILACLQ